MEESKSKQIKYLTPGQSALGTPTELKARNWMFPGFTLLRCKVGILFLTTFSSPTAKVTLSICWDTWTLNSKSAAKKNSYKVAGSKIVQHFTKHDI